MTSFTQTDWTDYLIENSTGVFELQLCLALMSYVGPTQFNENQFREDLKRLVSERKVVKLDYMLDGRTEYRIYFPANTQFIIGV